MKAKQVFEFVRNQDPIKSLGLGYEGKIRDFFRQYDIDDKDYEVYEDGEIVFNNTLDLSDKNVVELPDNLTVNSWVYLNNTNITRLPNNLIVVGCIILFSTKITKLPKNFNIKNKIYVSKDQIELIDFINNSKFKNKLKIYK
jgi:hypothetical protein